MNSTRLNIVLPDDLVREIDQVAGRRKRSQFIADAVKRRIIDLEKDRLQREMAEGYRAARLEEDELMKEFEAADLEGWDDY
jgi:metal-responsive CopG/Arc/MetJ family transcriptional regulator